MDISKMANALRQERAQQEYERWRRMMLSARTWGKMPDYYVVVWPHLPRGLRLALGEIYGP